MLIRQIAVPAAVGTFFHALYNFTDNFYAGLIGTQSVAAIALTHIIFFILTAFSANFTYAISALIGYSLGKKKYFLAGLYAKKAIVFIIIIAILMTVLMFLLTPAILSLLGAKGTYLSYSLAYINVIIIGNIFFAFNEVLNSILIAQGDAKSYRNALIFGFFLNLILNPLFIYGYGFIPAMNITGLALATVLIQIITNLYMVKKVLITGLVNFKTLKAFSIDWRIYKAFCTQGLPLVLNFATMSIGSAIIIYFVSRYDYKVMAAYGIGFRIEQLFLLLPLALKPAILAIVAHNFGVKRYDRVQQCFKFALQYAACLCCFSIIAIALIGESLIGLFDQDKAVIDYGFIYILIKSFTFFSYALDCIAIATLQGIKKPFIIPYVGIYRQILAPLIIYYFVVIVLKLDIIYLWLSLFAITTSAGIFIIFYALKEIRGIIINDKTIKTKVSNLS